MTDFAAAHAADGAAADLAATCADQLGEQGHTLGFVYATDALAGDMATIVEALKAGTGVADWVGTVGFGICAAGVEYFDRPAISTLTCRLPEEAYRLLPTLSEPASSSGKEADFLTGIGVVHGDPRNAQAAEIVASLAESSAGYLVGGLTAAQEQFPQVAGDVADVVDGGGVSGVLLGGELAVAVGLTQGCSPVGATHRATEAQRDILIKLDGRPAYEVLCEDVGIAEDADPRPWLADVHAALPVAGSDTADYLVRNLTGIDPDQGLVAIGDELDPGDPVLFVRRDEESAKKDLARMLKDLKGRAGGPPKAGLYYSCVARGPNMFEEEALELTAIKEVLGDFPLTGFFGNGEISHNRVYGYTGVLTLFL
jgi:small ligand-binding sensory domain FIST